MELNDYMRGSKQLCVSVSLADAVFLKKSQYSPSRLLRKAINDLKNNKSQDDLQEMFVKVENMSKLIQQQAQFVENKGLTEQFGHFQDKVEEDELKRHKNKEKEKEMQKEAEKVLEEALNSTNKSQEDKQDGNN